jgi:CheY-like chemotaxis protein
MPPRILIVDDENSIRTTLVRWFGLRGFDVDQAADGVDAIEKCRETEYDIITMDIEMPRMTGQEAIAEIRKFRPQTPIVVLTGFSRDSQPLLALGVAKILNKPLRMSELEMHVRQILDVSADAR